MQILFPFPVIYKNRRGFPRRFPLFPSRAFLREFSFLALSRDIIPPCMSISAELYSAHRTLH